MNKDADAEIMVKIAIALRKLLARNKSNFDVASSEFISTDDVVNSYEKIAMNTDTIIGKLTVTNAFSGKKKSQAITIVDIVKSMGFNMTDFGNVYDEISDEDILMFRNNHFTQNIN